MPDIAQPANIQTTLAPVLDQQGDWEAFSRPLERTATSTTTWESFVGIEGMHCAACSLTVEHALKSTPGVQDASVNAASRMARVVWSSAQTRPSQWFAAVQRAGYQAVPATEAGQAVDRAKASRLMLWRWLVAGFCMMQVMMYAVPSYLAAPGEMTPDLVQLMRWASWVLTLPVLLFSCRPFFDNAWSDMRHARVGMDVPVVLGILIAFAASSAGTFGGAGLGEVWYDSITMFVFFLLSGRMLELRLRDRTAGALEALSCRLPDSVLRRGADGAFTRVAVRRLQTGDVIRVLPGEAFPADGELLEGHTQVDEALLTGESRPLQRGPGQGVLAGSYNLSGVVLVRVLQAGAQTRYAGIVALMQDASTQKPELARLADRVAGPFLVAVIAASALACLWWWPTGAGHAIGVAIAVLIVTCPCALSLATPAAMLAAAGALARGGVLVRKLQALDAAAHIDTVIFDKTGTLTHDRMSVGAIRTRAGHEPQCMLALAASLASQSLHPASRALAEAASSDVPQATGMEEFPGQGISGWLSTGAGAGADCGLGTGTSADLMQLRLGSAAWCSAPHRPGDEDIREVHLSDAQGWLASFQLEETVRDDALATINELKSMGLQVQLLSGDRSAAVERLAWRLDIDACQGERSPEDKLAHVRQLQEKGQRVAMVGDGINDAPVLARADVSMSFVQAAPISRSQADFVFLGSQLAPVATVLRQAHRSRLVVRQNLIWAAAYNAVCVPLAIAGLMPPWLAGLGMAASSLLVILNAARLARLPRAAIQPAPARLATN
jgi:Cu2+-exporting ATPase